MRGHGNDVGEEVILHNRSLLTSRTGQRQQQPTPRHRCAVHSTPSRSRAAPHSARPLHHRVRSSTPGPAPRSPRRLLLRFSRRRRVPSVRSSFPCPPHPLTFLMQETPPPQHTPCHARHAVSMRERDRRELGVESATTALSCRARHALSRAFRSPGAWGNGNAPARSRIATRKELVSQASPR